jgi:hypothetical protein
MISGPILRVGIQSVAKYRPYWRVVFAIASFLYVATVYIILPLLGSTTNIIAFSFQLLVPIVAFLSVFQGRGPFKWLRGRERSISKRSIVARGLFGTMALLFTLTRDVLPVPLSIILDLIPLAILFWLWAGSSIRRWLARKNFPSLAFWRRSPQSEV